MDRFKRVGTPSKGGYVAYFKIKRQIVFAIQGDHVFHVIDGTEEDFVKLGTVADLMQRRNESRKVRVIFGIGNEALFRQKASML